MQVLRSFENTKTERQEIPVVQFPSLNIWDQTVSYLADAQRMYRYSLSSLGRISSFHPLTSGYTLTVPYNQFPYYHNKENSFYF